MKKLLFALVLFAAPAMAQETYSVPGTAGQVADLTSIVDASNGRLCEGAALATTCTQAQLCTAALVPGGASCTAAQARAAGRRIFPNTQPGREEFVQFILIAPRFLDMKADLIKRGNERMCIFWATATTLQKNTLCTDSGQASGCLLCQ